MLDVISFFNHVAVLPSNCPSVIPQLLLEISHAIHVINDTWAYAAITSRYCLGFWQGAIISIFLAVNYYFYLFFFLFL